MGICTLVTHLQLWYISQLQWLHDLITLGTQPEILIFYCQQSQIHIMPNTNHICNTTDSAGAASTQGIVLASFHCGSVAVRVRWWQEAAGTRWLKGKQGVLDQLLHATVSGCPLGPQPASVGADRLVALQHLLQ